MARLPALSGSCPRRSQLSSTGRYAVTVSIRESWRRRGSRTAS